MKRNNLKMYDRITVRQIDDDGTIVDERITYDNTSLLHRLKKLLGMDRCYANDLVTNVGLADVCSMVLSRYDYMSVGTGYTPPTAQDTQLDNEILTRSLCSKAQTTTFSTNDTATFTGTFTPSYNVEICECGIHTTAGGSGDIMLARETFMPIQCIADQTVQLVWSIILTR